MTQHEVVTLKNYLESRLDEMEKRWQVRSDLNDKALKSAADALNTRLEHLNEFRSQILEERSLYARREDTDYKISILQNELSKLYGRSAGKEWAGGVVIAVLLGIGALLTAILS